MAFLRFLISGFLLVTPLLRPGIALAQEPQMKHFAVNDGLASNTVYHILSDSKGFLWFCTDAGVSRFDGNRFTNFTLADGLSDNEMLRVYEDSKGRIWFLGFNGTLSYYMDGTFRNPENDSVLNRAKSSGSFLYFFEDRSHKLWFVSHNEYMVIDGSKVRKIKIIPYGTLAKEGTVMNAPGGGVYILTMGEYWKNSSLHYINGDTDLHYPLAYPKLLRTGFCYLTDGSLLFTAEDGIVRQKDTIQKLIVPLDRDNRVLNSIFLSSTGKLWLAVIGEGIACYDYSKLHMPPDYFLRGKNTCDIHEDIDGNVWIATLGEGIYMLPDNYYTTKNFTGIGQGSRREVFAVTKAQGKIYAGTWDEITVVDGNKLSPLKYNVARPGTRVTKIVASGRYIWVGSDNDLRQVDLDNGASYRLKYYNPQAKKILTIPGVKDICLEKNVFTVCTGYGILSKNTALKGSRHTPMNIIGEFQGRSYCVFTDSRGVTWYGTNEGLRSYVAAETRIHPVFENRKIRLNSIAETDDSTLVLATYGHGIFLYKHGKITAYISTQNGLPSNICKRIFVYGNELYVGTNNGAAVIKYDKGNIHVIKNYTTSDGLLSNDINDIFVDDSDICLATSGGLSVIDRKIISEKNDKPPPLYIIGIANSGRRLSRDADYTFSYKQNNIRFDFVAINYRNSKDIEYQYRLDETKRWTRTTDNYLDLPSLAPGSYHFELRARILNGPWSDTQEFVFTIKPPFWQTPWFAVLAAFSFISFVVIMARYRIKMIRHKQREELKIKDQVVRLEQQALQAMMNPHFIFNVMNSIQHYINSNERHEANVYLSDFARLIRMNLDISSKRYITLDEEVAYLKLYLSLESLRFGELLTYEIDIDSDIDGDETMIPVMLLQPFIENALWHGILPLKGKGHVQVNIDKWAELLKITITDNGVGIPAEKQQGLKTHESKGMKMTRQRLDLIGKISGHMLMLHIRDAFPELENKGTAVELLLPSDLQ